MLSRGCISESFFTFRLNTFLKRKSKDGWKEHQFVKYFSIGFDMEKFYEHIRFVMLISVKTKCRLRVDFTIMNVWVQTEMCLIMTKHKFAGCWIVRFHYLIAHYHLKISSSKLVLSSGSNCELCYYFAGNCTDYTGAYRCTCDPGYRGLNCTEDIDECESSPCAFGELSKTSLILYHPCKQTARFP